MTVSLQQHDGVWRVSGNLIMADAPRLLQALLQSLKKSSSTVLDLSGLGVFDSSLFAIVLELFRSAERQRRQFQISTLPSGFFAQAELYGCRELMLQLVNSGNPSQPLRR